MVSYFGLAQLAFPLVMAFAYLFFLIELVLTNSVLIPELVIFLILFILYGVSSFLLLQMQPGYEDLRNKSHQMGIENLFQFQGNEQRRKTIIAEIKKGDLAPSYIRGLEAELINLFGRNSFCDVCKFIKTPRAHHCRHCDRCILRMEYHCWFLGTCIGQANHRNYIQYLVFSTLLTAFVGLSCFANALKYRKTFDEWSNHRQYVYIFLSAINLAICLIASYFLFATLRSARKNITGIESKISIFKQNNPYANERYLEKMFTGPCDWLNLNYRADEFELQLVEESPFTDN